MIDLTVASAGSLFGMALAARLSGSMGDILVIGSEKMSSVLEAHPADPNIAILFGDGAGAALISPRPGMLRVLESVVHSDGANREDLSFHWNEAMRMNGPVVIRHASTKMPSAIREVLDRASIAPADVSTFLLHQANQNLLLRVAKALAVPPEHVFSNIAREPPLSGLAALLHRRTASEQTFSTIKDPATTTIARGWCRLMGLTPLALWIACLLAVRNQRNLTTWNTRQDDSARRAATGLPPKNRRQRRKTTLARLAADPP